MKQLPGQGPGKSCHYQEDTNDDYACDEKEEDEWSDHDAEMTITMPVTPERPSLVTKVPSFLQTTKQGIPDTPAKNIS